MNQSPRRYLPAARRDEIIAREVDGELLIYDRVRDKAHCLNETAAAIWKYCDGRTTTKEITEALAREHGGNVDENIVWLGLDEFGEPARKALIIAQAPPALRARTYGAYYLIRDCVVTSGSFLGAWLWSINPQTNFIGAALCGAAGTLWFWWFIQRRD